MFSGTHPLRLDEKGRLFLPAKFRDQLDAGVMITRGQDRCLYVFPHEEFERRAAGLADASLSARAARDYVRFLLGSAVQDIPDKQGRVTLTGGLRDYASLDRDCVIVGALHHAEIWNAEAWALRNAAIESQFSDLDEEVVAGLL